MLTPTPFSPSYLQPPAVKDLRGRKGRVTISGPTFLHFDAVFGKNWSKSMLAPPSGLGTPFRVWEILDPPLGPMIQYLNLHLHLTSQKCWLIKRILTLPWILAVFKLVEHQFPYQRVVAETSGHEHMVHVPMNQCIVSNIRQVMTKCVEQGARHVLALKISWK